MSSHLGICLDSGTPKQDLLASVRRLEAQLAQEKFFSDKSRAEQQHKIKTLNGKVKSLERQKQILLEKLKQNPNDQQNKMQSELNHTNGKLKDANQQLVTCSQQVEKLLQSNRKIEKANEKVTEQFLDKIKQKNLKIKNLEEQIKELKISQNDVQALNRPISVKNSCWKPGDTTQMWENWDDVIKQEEEKRRQKVHENNLVSSKGLEEKQQVETYTMDFFLSMHSGKEKTKDNQDLFEQGVLDSESVSINSQTNPEAGYQAHINKEQERPLKDTCSDIHKTIDASQSQVDSPNFQWIMENNKGGTKSNIGKMKLSSLPVKGKSNDELLSTTSQMKKIHKRGRTTECECIKRLESFYTRIGLGSKANAADDITEEWLQLSFDDSESFSKMNTKKRPPPGFNTEY